MKSTNSSEGADIASGQQWLVAASSRELLELLKLIQRRLDETGVPPDRLIFEITETAAVTNIARTATFASHLSDLGCKFAVDDFGAGFGSFITSNISLFDYLKIEVEFVRHCAENKTDRTLISAVAQIAHGIGKHTIAEFVDQWLLRRIRHVTQLAP